MGKTLVIAEKPSVAMNIAEALQIKSRKDGYLEGNKYIVTWAFGHLLQLFDAVDYEPEKLKTWQMENYPFIPQQFKYKVKTDPKDRTKPDKGAKKQLKTIHALMNRHDVKRIISSCDFDREGQIIGDSIIYQINPNKEVYRLLLNEWTPDEVRKGIENVVPNHTMQSLRDAGIVRQWADWIIGINLTAVTTLKYKTGKGKPLNIGRVLLPTLKIIYDRDKEIERFQPEDFYKLQATFQTANGESYNGIFHTKKEKDGDKFKTLDELNEISQYIHGQTGNISQKEISKRIDNPPQLFNLTNLQGFVTSKNSGWTSDKVLQVAQSLYLKKYITYPRSASQRLEESLVDRAKKVLEVHKKGLIYEKDIQFVTSKRIFDNSKVDSHSAIIPTYLLPEGLTVDETIVYQAIKDRFIMQFMPSAEYEETEITTKVNGVENGVFLTKGKVELKKGWKQVEQVNTEDTLLPQVNEGDSVECIDHKITSHVTKPPKHHSEKTLLRVMETCGKGKQDEGEEDDEEVMNSILEGYSIGTPATRADTIKKLKDAGYITNKNKNLICTDLGKRLIEIFPIKPLMNLDFTGRLEKGLSDIEKKKVSKDIFLKYIMEFTKKAVTIIKEGKEITLVDEEEEKQNHSLGNCPKCKRGKVIAHETFYSCSEFKEGCKFGLNKTISGKKISEAQMKKLLAKGKTDLIKGFTSKKEKPFDACLIWDSKEEKVKFGFPDTSKKPGTSPRSLNIYCPVCHKGLKEFEKFYGCSGYNDHSCQFSFSKFYLGHEITKEQVKRLCESGETEVQHSKKNGKIVEWILFFDKDKREIGFRYVN